VTILSIVQASWTRIGKALPLPTAAVSSTDDDVNQLVVFAQDSGRELMERANWVNLDTAGTVTGNGVATLFQLPIDWIRFSPSDKSPNGALVSNKFTWAPLFGPINTEDLNLLKAGPTSPVRPVWRIIGGALEIWPALATGEIVTFNYFSAFWIMNGLRTVSRAAFTKDDDFSLIPEDTVMKGTVWRWKAAKGLQYAEEFRAYEQSLSRNNAQQMTERVVDTSRKWVPNERMYFGTITDMTAPITG